MESSQSLLEVLYKALEKIVDIFPVEDFKTYLETDLM